MLTSKAHLLTTTLFAIFSFYAIFYSIYQTQLKFDETSEINLLSQDNTPWFQHKAKVVFVIIDGLRFDELLNYENIDHDPKLDRLKFSKFNQAYFENPERFQIVRAYADLPTMTILRVPCLMTGNVPRLGSVLTAFGALPASEDSVPRQLYLQGKKSYFSGDPILHEYFPQYLESNFKLGAFNVRDKQADAPSREYISEKLAENKFDFLAAHFLGVDHAGHDRNLYWDGVYDAIVTLDEYLIHMMETIDDNTMIVFIGDHGQIKEGGHGGGTPQETNTALMAYYKRGFLKNKYKNMDLKKIMRSINETDEQVHQIDVVPTLSMLMGLPTPFSNMGQIVNDLYPVGDYLPTPHPGCPETAFLEQLLRDNHLNTLQVWNYFKKYHEGQDLFGKQEFAQVADLYGEIDAAYKEAEIMISKSQQCETKFHEIAVSAIAKSQQLSNQVHDLVSNTTPHDLIVFWQAFLILILACVSYVLQVQYLVDTKDYEYITWSLLPKDKKAITKALVPITIILTLIWTFMLLSSPASIMRPITSSVLFLALYILGASITSFRNKPTPENASIPTSPTSASIEDDPQRLTFTMKTSFLFQSPLVVTGSVAVLGMLFYCTHWLHVYTLAGFRNYDPFVCIMLVAWLFAKRFENFSRKIYAAAGALCIILRLVNISSYWGPDINVIMGFIFVGDWLWAETQFRINKLNAGKAWSYPYLICMIVFVFFHMILDRDLEIVQIYLPRVIWAVLITSSLACFAMKLPGKTIKRYLQVNLVLFLCLMQMHRMFVYFGIILSVYRILTEYFKKAQFKNYLYTLIMGLVSYLGILYIGYIDRTLPRDFGPAFVGLRDFNIALCLIFYGSAMLSPIILAVLFMSFFDQELKLQEMELGVKMDESSDCEVVALKGQSKILWKRNIILFCFFYNVLMLGSAINPIVLTNHKRVYLSMERFLVDGVFYLFTINLLYLLF